MNKLTGIIFCMTAATLSGYAQERKERSEMGEDIREMADTVSNRTKEAAAKSKAILVDKVMADKVGPGGQTIYIDKHAKYYYINNEGERVYIKASRLKDKPENK